MTSSSNGGTPKKCGLTELIVFIIAVVTGTACSICSKVMMDLHAQGMTDKTEQFSKPLFQTFGMFVGMMFGLVMHFCVKYWRLDFPGYHMHEQEEEEEEEEGGVVMKETDHLLKGKRYSQSEEEPVPPELPVSLYFQLAIPALFDLGATALCMLGLRYLDVSIYQLLRGGGVIFVALMKQNFLGHRLYNFQWVGVMWNVVSVVLVGMTAVLDEGAKATLEADEKVSGAVSSSSSGGGSAFVGVVFVMAGAFVQALQYVYEEKMMTMDIPAPPLLLIGMEGLWGTFFCVSVLYPIAYWLPGDDHGSFESAANTWHMITHSSSIQWMFLVYFVAIFGYNLFAVLVTYLMNSIWHAILDNFRPITVWMTDLFIFYFITSFFGEPWDNWSYLQLMGMIVLLYGTAIYNGPNDGSILLRGEWFAFGFDFSKEYLAIQLEQEEAEADMEWEDKRKAFGAMRNNSSFIGQREPFLSASASPRAHTVHDPSQRSVGASSRSSDDGGIVI